MSFPSPKGATVLEYEYCTSNATRRSGMENEYMKVAYDIIHIYALVLIIASSMHSTELVGSGNAESTITVCIL